jgi:hypothetical protein
VLKCNVYLNDLKDYDGMNECSVDDSATSHLCGRQSPQRVEFRGTRWSRST